MIERSKPVLVMRYNNYKDNDFILAHSELIQNCGCAWILKLGKKIPEQSLKKFLIAGGHLFLKAPKTCGGGYYYAHMIDYFVGKPKSQFVYPEYYQDLVTDSYDYTLDGTWICVDSIVAVNENVIDHLQLIKNGKKLSEAAKQTRTATFYVESDQDIAI